MLLVRLAVYNKELISVLNGDSSGLAVLNGKLHGTGTVYNSDAQL